MNKKITAIFLAVLLCVLMAGCGDTQQTQSQQESRVEYTPNYTDEALSGDWDRDLAIPVILNGDSIDVSAAGATVNGSVLTITRTGTFLISGTLNDGQIIVQADKNDTVQLVLNGVDITCSTSAPIYSAKAGKTIITLVEGTTNILTDGSEYQYPDEATDEPDACLFVKDDLTINGTGTLQVTGNFNNGIGAKDDLVIASGTIEVTAVNHGIRGRDSLTILDGNFTIQSGNDGLQSNNDNGDGKGWILLENGSYSITSDHDGIQAETNLTIQGGTFTIVSGGGNGAQVSDPNGSYKGLKAGGNLTVTAGSFDIDSADDTLHANGNVTISDGVFTLASGDDGVHADGDLTIEAGVIEITASYEGLEGSTINISGGEIRLNASDDGINVAGGNDSSGQNGRFGMDRFSADENLHMNISGGWTVVSADGDGIDSNGYITMTGGTVLVNGPTRGADAAIDFDGEFDIHGGILVAAGSSGMAQAPGATSTQATLMVYFTETQTGGTPVHLEGSDGTSILTFTPTKEFQTIVISTPELEQGAVYNVYIGGSDSGESIDGLVTDCNYSGGTLLVEVTLSEITTKVSDTGEAVSGFGGFGGGRGDGFPGGGMPGNDSGTPGQRPDGEGGLGEGGMLSGDPPGDPPSDGGMGLGGGGRGGERPGGENTSS